MAGEGTRDATIGFFVLLLAAFMLLAGFVFLIGVLYRPSVLRFVLAVGVLLLGGLLVRTGYAAFHRASRADGVNKEEAALADPEERSTHTEAEHHGPGNDP